MFEDDSEKLGSCKTYARLARVLSEKYRIPSTVYGGGRRANQLLKLIDTIIKNECSRAAEEAVYRIRCHDVALVRDTTDASAYLPTTSIRVGAGGVGMIKIRKFRLERAFAAA